MFLYFGGILSGRQQCFAMRPGQMYHMLSFVLRRSLQKKGQEVSYRTAEEQRSTTELPPLFFLSNIVLLFCVKESRLTSLLANFLDFQRRSYEKTSISDITSNY